MLNETTWTRCIVQDVRRDDSSNDQIIKCYEDGDATKTEMMCRLKHPWNHSRIKKNDVISLKAIWCTDENSFCVTSSTGFKILNPDTLVSCTSLMDWMYCERKAARPLCYCS